MAKNESVDFFLRFLNERFAAFREALMQLLEAISLEDKRRKGEAAKKVLHTIDDLKRSMSATDHPSWLGQLEGQLKGYLARYEGHPDSGKALLAAILHLHPAIEDQKWVFAEASPAAIDFAAIYEEYYAASRVPELFQELIGHLETIIQSGEIDSIQTIKALEKLIATLRKNARGDYFSTRGAWEFTQVFFRNFSIELFEDIPVLKHVFKALRKTMSELDLEMNEVHDQVRRKLAESAKEELPMLEYKALALPPPPQETE
jgi:hypothetical protein